MEEEIESMSKEQDYYYDKENLRKRQIEFI